MRSEVTRADFISIAVADTTRIHTQLLAEAIKGDGALQVVASAPSSRELLEAAGRVPIDVAVISLLLDDQPGRGLEVLRQMRALHPDIKGVILLESSRSQDVLDCFQAGARGIFSRHDRLESLCKCIRRVYEGQVWARSAEIGVVLEALANSPVVHATNHEGMELLSSREREVIQYLASGMTNREIAEALGLSRHTVKNYLFRIFDKVGVSSRTELICHTMNRGKRPVEESETNVGESLSRLIKAAESGMPWAQRQLAEHYLLANGSSDPVAAYMWFLLCQETTKSLHSQVDARKASLAQSMSAHQIAEAERRARAWLQEEKVAGLQDMKKKSGFVVDIEEERKKSGQP
jgi:two-component system nitrate/nitrite response regulator NarL